MPSVDLSVRVTPRAAHDAVVGVRDGTLHVRVAAPPAEGAANRACAELVAKALSLRRTQVVLVGGQTARNKRFAIQDITPDELRRRLAALEAGPRT